MIYRAHVEPLDASRRCDRYICAILEHVCERTQKFEAGGPRRVAEERMRRHVHLPESPWQEFGPMLIPRCLAHMIELLLGAPAEDGTTVAEV